jgi:TolB protein
MVLAACSPGETQQAVEAVFIDAGPNETHLTNIQQLTFGGNNAESYFSASGEQIVFQRQEVVGEGCDQQFTMNVDGTDMKQVSNGFGRTTCGYFIQNDERIVYSSTYEHDRACPARPDFSQGYVWPIGHFEIYSANTDGSDLVNLTDNGYYNAESTLSPDGNRLIFTSTMDGDLDLYTMNVDGSDVRRITDRLGYDGGAFFSPDGSKIVWRAMYPETAKDSADYQRLLADRLVRPSNLELWLADADGSNARQITELGSANFAPFFHPDGQRIIFASNHETADRIFNLYIIHLDGSGLERVTYGEDFDGFPMFSPDGAKLMWASNRNGASEGDTNIFIADWVE